MRDLCASPPVFDGYHLMLAAQDSADQVADVRIIISRHNQ